MFTEKFCSQKKPSLPLEPGEAEIKSLVSRLHGRDYEESKKATWSISNLSRHPINRRTILKEDALPILVQFINKTDARVIDVIRLLTHFSQTAAFRKEILSSDSLSSVIMLIKTGRMSFVEQSMEFVANMCLNRQAREMMMHEKGFLEVLLVYLKKAREDQKRHVVRALVKLSSVASVSAQLLKLNAVKVFVDCLMTSEDATLRAWLAELIHNLSRESKTLNRFGSVCVWQLLDLLDERSDIQGKIWALKALGILTRGDHLRRAVMRQGGIRLITALLKSDHPICVDEAVNCLANLTQDPEKVSPCMRKGVMTVLVKLLETKSLNALKTVANVSEVEEQRWMLLQSGVIPLLVQFLRTNEATVDYKEDTLRCLAHLSAVETSISWFLDQSLITQIVHSLRSPCLKSCSYAAQILYNISASSQGAREVVNSGTAIWLLVGLLRSKSPEAVLSAVKALSVLSTNRNARSLISQYDGISNLIRLVKEAPDETKIYAAKTLYDLSTNMEVQRAIVTDDGIPALISTLSSQNFEVKESALCLLIRLGLSKQYWGQIKEGGGVGLMLKQLLVSELRDTFGVCQSFVRFFNAVFFAIIKGQFGG